MTNVMSGGEDGEHCGSKVVGEGMEEGSIQGSRDGRGGEWTVGGGGKGEWGVNGGVKKGGGIWRDWQKGCSKVEDKVMRLHFSP